MPTEANNEQPCLEGRIIRVEPDQYGTGLAPNVRVRRTTSVSCQYQLPLCVDTFRVLAHAQINVRVHRLVSLHDNDERTLG